jgi:hypothetical protein
MKKILIFISVFVLSFSFAQDCKLKKNEIDSFTKQKVLQTQSYAVFSEIGRSVTLEFNLNQSLFIDFEYESQSSKVRLINESDNILFLLKDGSVISCSNSQFVDMERKDLLGMGSISSIYKMKLAITLEELQRINSINIKTIRIENSEDPIDLELKDKRAIKVYKLLDCFLQQF